MEAVVVSFSFTVVDLHASMAVGCVDWTGPLMRLGQCRIISREHDQTASNCPKGAQGDATIDAGSGGKLDSSNSTRRALA
jgi:hypothetical protein